MNSSLKFQIADISIYELELSQIFQEQYNDLYSNILHISQDEFISNLHKASFINDKNQQEKLFRYFNEKSSEYFYKNVFKR